MRRLMRRRAMRFVYPSGMKTQGQTHLVLFLEAQWRIEGADETQFQCV
jgi:hypothetical protein